MEPSIVKFNLLKLLNCCCFFVIDHAGAWQQQLVVQQQTDPFLSSLMSWTLEFLYVKGLNVSASLNIGKQQKT